MILRSYLFKRVAIIGVGLMGGSLGMAIKKNKLAKEVIGVSHRQASLNQALQMGAIDIAEGDLQKAVRNADLVVIATPVEAIKTLLGKVQPYLKRSCIVTDVGSTKHEIVEVAKKVLANPGNFIGSHPLVGSEKKGVENGRAEMFEGAITIITPTQQSSQSVTNKLKQLWSKVGSNVKVVSPEEHDEILASVSHLPHLLAYGLIETTPQKHLEYSTQSLKDTTRIASSSPMLWHDVCLSNAKHVVKSLDDLIVNLAVIRKSIVSKDQKILLDFFTKAKEKRDGIINSE